MPVNNRYTLDDMPGAIKLHTGDTPPRNYLLCQGAIVSQSAYPRLFAVCGNKFGSAPDGMFRLPDMRGRVAIGAGTGDGLTPRALGANYGEENHIVTADELPEHGHTVRVYNATGNSGVPTGRYLAASKADAGGSIPIDTIYTTSSPNATLASDAIGTTGSSSPISLIQPSAALNYIIRI